MNKTEMNMKLSALLDKYAAKYFEATQKWAEACGYKEGNMSSEAENIRELLEKSDADQALTLAIEKMLGTVETLSKKVAPASPSGPPISFAKGIVVVPLTNPNSHNYPLHKPVMVSHVASKHGPNGTTAGSGLRPDGVKGNNLPGYKNAVRPATMEEIRNFLIGGFERFALLKP